MDQLIIFNHRHTHQPLLKNFPQLFQAIPKSLVSQFQTPGTTVTANGLLPHAMLYSLGHNRDLPVELRTDPKAVRALGGFLRHARATANYIHLFVPVDVTNGLISTQSLDTYLRIFAQLSIPVRTHLVTWIATPSEIHYIQHLIASLGLELGPQSSITDLFNRGWTQSYIRQHLVNTVGDSVSFLLVHDSASLGFLSDEIRHLAGSPPACFDRFIESPSHTLASHQVGHTEWLTNNPLMARYYWGDDITRQATVFDSNTLDTINHSTSPYRVWLLDERMSKWDSQLAKMVSSRPTSVYWIDPFRLDGHLVSQPITGY